MRHDHKKQAPEREAALVFPFVPVAKVLPQPGVELLQKPHHNTSQQTGGCLGHHWSNAPKMFPCKMAGGCSASLWRGGFAEWKILIS